MTGFVAPTRVKSITLYLSAAALAVAPIGPACAQSAESVGGIVGGILGGILGNAAGRDGDKVITTLVGAGIGGFVGSRIGRALSQRDKEELEGATQRTVNSGQNQSWTGDRARGRTELVGTERRQASVPVPVLKERVSQVPPLDFINASYAATRREDVRGGPGTNYVRVAGLSRGEVVNVTGKVQDSPWYLISQNGVGVGFVHEDSLEATTAAPAQVAALSGAVETRSVEVERTCRTVKQIVVRNGREASEDVTACQTASGWEVV